ncbi:hypothetical protein [Paenibacillus thiaminolyticus]|uniref:hypothetical protein n=1 Tax=Paenibacillus thiaminolyticus TaxID=49283 RepID=UPI0015FF56D8|nr:hypothetical protein [Paenibacillus thiaminolyticus]
MTSFTYSHWIVSRFQPQDAPLITSLLRILVLRILVLRILVLHILVLRILVLHILVLLILRKLLQKYSFSSLKTLISTKFLQKRSNFPSNCKFEPKPVKIDAYLQDFIYRNSAWGEILHLCSIFWKVVANTANTVHYMAWEAGGGHRWRANLEKLVKLTGQAERKLGRRNHKLGGGTTWLGRRNRMARKAEPYGSEGGSSCLAPLGAAF